MPTYLTIEVINDDKSQIKVKFNDLATHEDVNGHCGTWSRRDMVRVFHNLDPDYISVTMASESHKWLLNLDGSNGAYPVTSITGADGVKKVVGVDILTIEDLNDELDKLKQ